MSTNATAAGSTPSSSLSASVAPTMSSLIVNHTLLTLLFPLAGALFYSSTKQSRRRPLFLLNITAICIATGLGILVDAYAIHLLTEPLNPWSPAFNIIIGFIAVILSIFVDSTLFVRLIYVYPLFSIGPLRFFLLIAIPVMLKFTRIINIALFTKAMVHAMDSPNGTIRMAIVFSTAPYLKIEWAAQLIDNTYASIAFLLKMDQHTNSRTFSRSSRATLVEGMRTLARIALANFVIPTLFSIAQFICVYRNINPIVLNEIVLTNIMLATFGVAFATVWAGNINKQEERILDAKRNFTSSRLFSVFGRGANRSNRSVTITGSGHTTNSNEDFKV